MNYEVVGKVEFVPNSHVVAAPGQTVGTSKQQEPARDPERGKFLVPNRTRSPPICRLSTKPSARARRVQSWMEERALTS